MKRISSLVFAIVLAPMAANAVPCASGLLSSYIGSSCSDGSGVTFDNWTYADGGSGVFAADINVIASNKFGNVRFDFRPITPWTAAAGATITPTVGYTVTKFGVGAIIQGSFLQNNGSVSIPGGGTGSVTITMNECLDGLLPGCSPGRTANLASYFDFSNLSISYVNIRNRFDEPKPATVDVMNQIAIVGGTTGATLSGFSNDFFIVPEPLPMELTLLGGLLIAASRRWIVKRS